MANMELVMEKFVAGDVPRFGKDVEIIDRREDLFREVLLVKKSNEKYIVAIRYLASGDDGGYVAGIWKAKTVKKYKATEEDLFKAVDSALELLMEVA